MTDLRLLALAKDCRERAQEILTKAEAFNGADIKLKMRVIAAQYQDLAMRLETAARD
jgi:hypothetical protein